jgi:hypothetical protein
MSLQLKIVSLIVLGMLLFTLPVFAVIGPLGNEVRVNTSLPYPQAAQDIAIDPAGNFVIVWYSGRPPCRRSKWRSIHAAL